MALVGGFGVGTIELMNKISERVQILVGQELGKFNLGSTVCLATPEQIEVKKFLEVVSVGQAMPVKS